MKIIYKILAIYSLIVIGFLMMIALPIVETSSIHYFFGVEEYIVGRFTLIPVTLLALWSLFKKT